MSMNFTATVVAENPGSKVEEVFNRDVVLTTEVAGESRIPAGHIGLIDSFRGFTLANTQGRKSPDAGRTMVDLGAVSRIRVDEIPALVFKLQELAECAPDAAEALEALRAPALAAVEESEDD